MEKHCSCATRSFTLLAPCLQSCVNVPGNIYQVSPKRESRTIIMKSSLPLSDIFNPFPKSKPLQKLPFILPLPPLLMGKGQMDSVSILSIESLRFILIHARQQVRTAQRWIWNLRDISTIPEKPGNSLASEYLGKGREDSGVRDVGSGGQLHPAEHPSIPTMAA